MKLKKILYISPIITTLPLSFVVSCSSSSNENNFEHSNAYKLIKEYLDANNKMFQSTKTIANDKIKGIVEIKNNGFEAFKQAIESYFNLEPSFSELLTKNNNELYKQIQQVNIQPFPNSKNLNVVIFIGSSSEDKDVVSEKVLNVLVNNFAYAREFEISKKSVTQIGEGITSKEFQELTNNLANNTTKKIDLIKKAFNILNLSVIQNNISSFIIEPNSTNYTISISLNKQDIEKGFIIKDSSNSNNPYRTKIISNSIAKN